MAATAAARQPLAPWKNATAATLGASVTALAVTPLDVVKVQMQSHVCIPVAGGGSCSSLHHPPSILSSARALIASSGLPALYRGLPITLLLAIPTTGLYFTLYESLLSLPLHPLLAGATARTVSATVAAPLELARTRLQAGLAPLPPSGSVFRGLAPTLLRDAPFSAIYWSLYERLRPRRGAAGDDGLLPQYVAAGTMAGSVAATVTTPADVVKTRMQAGGGAVGMGEVVRGIWVEEGARGFARGLAPRVAKVAPSCAIMMGTYEFAKRMLA